MAKNVGHRFQKGNKYAVGNPGPARAMFLTQELIIALKEIDPKANRTKYRLMVEQLVKQAAGFVLVEKVKDPKTGKIKKIVETDVSGDLSAIKFIFERIEGAVKQSVEMGAGEGGRVTLVFEKADEKL